ncbi:hypothetical protein M378DRAFT_28637, partial [Amanita muscaria Koide BX008]
MFKTPELGRYYLFCWTKHRVCLVSYLPTSVTVRDTRDNQIQCHNLWILFSAIAGAGVKIPLPSTKQKPPKHRYQGRLLAV